MDIAYAVSVRMKSLHKGEMQGTTFPKEYYHAYLY